MPKHITACKQGITQGGRLAERTSSSVSSDSLSCHPRINSIAGEGIPEGGS